MKEFLRKREGTHIKKIEATSNQLFNSYLYLFTLFVYFVIVVGKE